MTVKRSKEPDAVLLAGRWGALWAVALGLWLLAPDVLDTHHLRPVAPAQWVVVLVALAAIFAALGAVLGIAGGFLLFVVETLTAGRFRDRVAAYGLFSGIAVALAYVGESLFIHWTHFGAFDFPPSAYQGFVVLAASFALAAALLAVVYRFVARDGRTKGPAGLRSTLAAACVFGAIALVFRLPVAAGTTRAVALEPASTTSSDVPLLFIGLDGASWDVLQTAMANGSAPTLQRLATAGTTGTVEALWPPYWSGAAWASIVTGLPREHTGVYEDLAAIAPGLPLFQAPLGMSLRLNPFYSVRRLLLVSGAISYVPPPRTLLRARPVWELLHEQGVRTAVVRFRFTYPPQGQGETVVSDWVGRDHWEALGVERQPDVPAVVPHEQASRLLAPFHPDTPPDPQLLERLLPGAHGEANGAIAEPIRELASAADIDSRTFDAADIILAGDRRLPFLAVYIGGLDSVQHAFWPYRSPEDFPGVSVDRADMERLSPVINRYVGFLDRRLGQLLAMYDHQPNVLLVSDHGFGAGRGDHASDGVLLASGPTVPHSRERLPVSYYDIVPTIAGLKGFRHTHLGYGRSIVAQPTSD